MRTIWMLACLLLMTSLAGAAPKVTVDYDQDTDFSKFETFQFIDTEKSSLSQTDPFMHKRIVEILEERLIAGGMKKVTENPDLYITYHGRSREGSKFQTSSYGYDTWDGAYVTWGGEVHTQSEFIYEEGTLIVDGWDARGKNLVWRGMSTQILKNTADKREKQMEQAVSNMSKKWKKLRAGKRR